MQYIATNVRFSPPEYREIKRLALIEKKSIASLIREAIREYRIRRITRAKSNLLLFKKIIKSTIPIDINVTELVHEGRRFE